MGCSAQSAAEYPIVYEFGKFASVDIYHRTIHWANTLSINVDAIIDVEDPQMESDEGVDTLPPLMEQTLHRRGLSDSSIRSTFTSHVDELPSSPNPSSRDAHTSIHRPDRNSCPHHRDLPSRPFKYPRSLWCRRCHPNRVSSRVPTTCHPLPPHCNVMFISREPYPENPYFVAGQNSTYMTYRQHIHQA